MKNIAVHLATGFEETEAITVIDILRRAQLNVTTVSITGDLKVTGAHNISVEADKLFENICINSLKGSAQKGIYNSL